MLDITPWQNFGLAGMVIGALFLTIWMVGKSIILHLLNMQREERAEWRECFEKSMADHTEVIRELTQVVHQIKYTMPEDIEVPKSCPALPNKHR
jgi:1,2-phenylacetyl-CoA epoxidase PaaB subunit